MHQAKEECEVPAEHPQLFVLVERVAAGSHQCPQEVVTLTTGDKGHFHLSLQESASKISQVKMQRIQT